MTAPTAQRPTRPQGKDRRTPARRTLRRLAYAALFAAVRGLAYAAGSGLIALIIWWITTR
ncbi:hypothetical protein [Thermomonospora amylolytica]|uniref:hypothetical protein n=1 Tax=Thermomonospora amylolytica TaxID=1411117 RepID=UPI000E6B63BB|nr:hypothetical protein [Thermomonospora amylolytica]